jgi:hypothetical protein
MKHWGLPGIHLSSRLVGAAKWKWDKAATERTLTVTPPTFYSIQGVEKYSLHSEEGYEEQLLVIFNPIPQMVKFYLWEDFTKYLQNKVEFIL